MQIKNNYDIYWEKEKDGKTEMGSGVFNGEIGTITKVDDRERQVEIQFDDEKIAWYQYQELDQIEHSYAITIHKAQRKWIWCGNNGNTTNSTNVINEKSIVYRNNKSKKTISNNRNRKSN